MVCQHLNYTTGYIPHHGMSDVCTSCGAMRKHPLPAWQVLIPCELTDAIVEAASPRRIGLLLAYIRENFNRKLF